MEIYRKLNPVYQQQHFETSFNHETEAKSSSNCGERSEIFILGDETLMSEQTDEDEYIGKAEEISSKSGNFTSIEENEEQYENIYLEFEEEEEEMQETPKQCKQMKSEPSDRVVMNRKSYTVKDKLKIIEYAEENNNRVAARHFNINESSVRCFRRQKDSLIEMFKKDPQKKTNRKAFPHWPKLEEELKQFVLNHDTKPKLKEIQQEAINIANKQGIENFSGTNSYIFKFMTRNNLPSASPRPRKNKRPLRGSDK